MKPARILVAEEPQSIEIDLANRLNGFGFELQKFVSTPEQAMDYLREHTVDLVLMDVFYSKNNSGLHTAHRIRDMYGIPIILMITDNRFKQNEAIPFPIVFKPAQDQLLYHTIHLELDRARTENVHPMQYLNDDLFVRSDYRLNKIRIMDIYYVEAMKDYVMIHTRDNTFKVHTTIKNLMDHLLLPQFIRIHRSFIVNRSKIASIKFPELVIEDKMKTLTIGGLYRKELFDQLNIL